MAEQTNEQKLRDIEKLCGKVALPGVPELTADELRQLQSKQEVVLVDVRTPDEQVVSMIPGAITASEFEDANAVSARASCRARRMQSISGTGSPSMDGATPYRTRPGKDPCSSDTFTTPPSGT